MMGLKYRARCGWSHFCGSVLLTVFHAAHRNTSYGWANPLPDALVPPYAQVNPSVAPHLAQPTTYPQQGLPAYLPAYAQVNPLVVPAAPYNGQPHSSWKRISFT